MVGGVIRSCFEGLHRLPAGLDTFWGSNDKSSDSIEPGETDKQNENLITRPHNFVVLWY